MYNVLIVFVTHPQGGVKQNTSQVVQFSSLEAAPILLPHELKRKNRHLENMK